ncbi:hypothetical protein RUMCAL_02604 [Ruminococcus callidus ATCC 27760]|uniref:Uncharacterized protein n=1 Tax=Ruminococcus callidus ATCC 27760 TaxID=411473 RepID=U2JYK6_9FIRM|nr:hypothetical protein RUMCAL_02604 [Ruminococcus callidus ATCC 27760]
MLQQHALMFLAILHILCDCSWFIIPNSGGAVKGFFENRNKLLLK